MAIEMKLWTLSEGNINRIVAEPYLAWRLVAQGDDLALLTAATKQRMAQARPTLNPLPTPKPGELALTENEAKALSLREFWHGFHYLLTGSPVGGLSPAAFIRSGGEKIPHIDLGHGPMRAFRRRETREITRALRRIDGDTMRGRYAPDAMNNARIYPTTWGDLNADTDNLGDLIHAVPDFIQSATDRDLGIVLLAS